MHGDTGFLPAFTATLYIVEVRLLEEDAYGHETELESGFTYASKDKAYEAYAAAGAAVHSVVYLEEDES